MSKFPFDPLIDAMKKRGMNEYDAVFKVQERLDKFVDEKVSNAQRLDVESNEMARHSTNALVTLATVLIPLIGLIFSQEKIVEILNPNERFLVFESILLLFISIIFGVLSYMSSGRFFKRWADGTAKALGHVNNKVDDMKSTGELYDAFDKKMVELKLIKSGHQGTISSNKIWDYLQMSSVFFAGVLIMVLIYNMLEKMS